MGEKLVKLQPLMEICGFLPCFLLTAYPKNLDKRSMKAFVQQNNVLELQRLELKSHNSPKPFSFSSKVPQIKGLSDYNCLAVVIENSRITSHGSKPKVIFENCYPIKYMQGPRNHFWIG